MKEKLKYCELGKEEMRKSVKFMGLFFQNRNMTKTYITGVATCLVLFLSCTPGGSSERSHAPERTYKPISVKESSTSGNITIAVDETYQPIIESAIETFQGTYPDAHINAIYQPGEKAVESMLNSDTIRLVITSRELSQTEKNYLVNQSTSAKTSRIATDAIAFITHPDNPVNRMASFELEDVLTGKIQRWDEASKRGKKEDITITFDNALSSTLKFLRDSVLTERELTTENIFASNSNPEVIAYVAKSPNALGIIGVPWISDQDDEKVVGFLEKVNVLAIVPEYECSFSSEYAAFQPYQAFIKQNCYPYSRGIYTILRESHFGLGSGFVAYLAHDQGQRIFHKAGLVPDQGMTRIVKFPSKQEQSEAQQ
ncbi:MAG: substrate-binding domain-containing protein [Bacteroidota bacterium]